MMRCDVRRVATQRIRLRQLGSGQLWISRIDAKKLCEQTEELRILLA